jgi:hypothetical protein
MKILILIVCLFLSSASSAYSQTTSKEDANAALQRAVLLSDLNTLALEIPKLDGQLARAMAKAEIADAAWTLDRKWARKLLREAYELTYLTEDEFRKLGPESPGSAPRPPTAIGRARDSVRRRILSVARRDKAFADELLTDSSARVSKGDRQMMYAQLTRMALDGGDRQAAVRSIEDNMAIDPTSMIFVELVHELVLTDPGAADKLILKCIDDLSTIRLANDKMARARSIPTLMWLVFPNSFFPDYNKRIPNPGPEAMKAYVRFVIEDLTAQEQKEPGSLARERYLLLSTWLPLNKYAPEYRERFMQLEAFSRTPGKDASLPTRSSEEIDYETFRKKQAEALNAAEPSGRSIDIMIQREDFETARKLISKLPDGPEKTQLTEQVNTREALSFVKQGDLLSAQNLAERFVSVNSIVQVYPLIVEGYAKNKNQLGAGAVVRQAIKQLKTINSKAASPSTQFGMPAEYAPTAKERDGMLTALGKLAKAVLPVDTLLAAEIVDEIVVIANASQLDTSQGQTGIDSDLFKGLAARDEFRARSAADSFKDRLRRIVATAAIYHKKAQEAQKQ